MPRQDPKSDNALDAMNSALRIHHSLTLGHQVNRRAAIGLIATTDGTILLPSADGITTGWRLQEQEERIASFIRGVLVSGVKLS